MKFLIWGHVFDDFVHESLEVDSGFRLRCLLDHFSRVDIQRRIEVESVISKLIDIHVRTTRCLRIKEDSQRTRVAKKKPTTTPTAISTINQAK